MKIGIVLLMLMLSQHLFAQNLLGGSEVGNGGGFVYCVSPVDQTRTPRVTIDYWEMQNVHGYVPLYFPSSSSYLEILSFWIDSLPNEFSNVKNKFEESITYYLENVQYVSEVNSLDDLAQPNLPRDCYAGTVAHFTVNPLLFYLERHTFNSFDELNKAIIVFHEVLYYLKINYALMSNHHDLRHEVAIFFQNETDLKIPYLKNWEEVLRN